MQVSVGRVDFLSLWISFCQAQSKCVVYIKCYRGSVRIVVQRIQENREFWSGSFEIISLTMLTKCLNTTKSKNLSTTPTEKEVPSATKMMRSSGCWEVMSIFSMKKQLVHMLKQDIPGVSWTNNASYLRMFSSKYRAQFHIQTPFCL
ncbi:uncharacterized protein LOC110656822 isoform X2 [Hevea brasiliensis]|uniref:uncharacterized protein LOC110656822 isoform X2 n=1 Tax=Hevea brasiliensis TaxID=3981 RepID=UPI0025DD177F|nr:uncharacterized protein LOC110656822 isoform X2 [Hevea brasiliensis]